MPKDDILVIDEGQCVFLSIQVQCVSSHDTERLCNLRCLAERDNATPYISINSMLLFTHCLVKKLTIISAQRCCCQPADCKIACVSLLRDVIVSTC
jgi:hypothetical protein